MSTPIPVKGPPARTTGRATFGQNLRILVFGPPKHGKTLLASTLSEHFAGWPAPRPGTVLDDVLYVAFDANAIEGLIEQGYDAHIIDRSTHTEKLLIPALDKLETEVPDYVAAYGIKIVVVDTISFLDKHLNEWFSRTYSKWDLYAQVNSRHTRFVSMLKKLPCTIVVNAHSKADIAVTDAAGQAKEKATALPGSGGISSQITGQTKGTYEGLVSMILPMMARDVVKDGKVVRERIVMPFGGSGFEGASRYQRFLGKEEPADLKALINKVRAGVEAEWSAASKT